MASKDRTTFETVDWDPEETSTTRVSYTGFVELALMGIVVAGFLYDYFVIENQYPIINFDVPITGWAVQWNINSVEWMFLPVLIAMVFHLVVPLYRNKRRTMYYWQEFRRNKAAVISLAFLIIIFFIGMIGPIFLDPPRVSFTGRFIPPVGVTTVVNGVEKTGTWAHPLGTNGLGQDMVKLLIYGMRVSMEVGLIAMAIAMVIGTVVGAVAAYATSIDRGMIDETLMRYVDLQSIFPAFILLLLVIYLFGASLWLIIAVYGFFGWEGIARTTRGEALQRVEEGYVEAARAAGADTGWIVRRHIIPNVSNTTITLASLLIPAFILGEAALAFLGFSDPSTFSWGRTIASGQDNLASAWWIATIPGLFLVATALAFNFVGDALRDALDPRHEAHER